VGAMNICAENSTYDVNHINMPQPDCGEAQGRIRSLNARSSASSHTLRSMGHTMSVPYINRSQ